MNFQSKFDKVTSNSNSLLCVGLDSDIGKLPGRFNQLKHPQFEFNKWVIEQTHDLVCAYKPNIAFYEARGAEGLAELKMTMSHLQEKHPEVVTICDAKRADIGNTNEGYVTAIFDKLGFDAVTLHPYLGREALQPFLDKKDKGCIILCRTSNSGAGEFQDLMVDLDSESAPLWQVVAQRVRDEWNTNNNCLLVVGATYPKELEIVRKLVGDMTLLVPGIGAQGGDLKAVTKAGLNSKGAGIIINSSRGIIFADNPKNVARELRDKINEFRK